MIYVNLSTFFSKEKALNNPVLHNLVFVVVRAALAQNVLSGPDRQPRKYLALVLKVRVTLPMCT